MSRGLSLTIRYFILAGILFSMATIYYSKVILLDYDIITNEEGPSLEE